MNVVMLVARLIVGLGIAAHGSQKLFGWFHGPGLKGTAGWLESLGYRPGIIYALGSGLSELIGGVLVALGLLNGIGPGLVILVMLVAILTVHIGNGFSLQTRWIILGAAAVLALLNFATRRRKGSAAAAV